jgi:hypothetical protein
MHFVGPGTLVLVVPPIVAMHWINNNATETLRTVLRIYVFLLCKLQKG